MDLTDMDLTEETKNSIDRSKNSIDRLKEMADIFSHMAHDAEMILRVLAAK